MKEKLSKVLVVILITELMLLLYFGVFCLFNSLVAYKNASGNDWLNFAGGIIGSLIAGMIAVVTFLCTIKNNDKNQKEAHELQTKLNIENNHLQTSLKVEDNLNRKMEKERFALANTYNQLENFLFTVANMLYKNDDFIEMKNDFMRLYGEFISSINNIKFNSEIFDDRSKCENCEMCDIKIYGTLVKVAMDIQKEILIIDVECRIALDHLVSALNMAAQNIQLLDEKSNLEKININTEKLIEIKKSQIINPIGALTLQEQACYNEILSLSENIKQHNQRISELYGLIENNLKSIGDEINLAKSKADQIDKSQKMQLDNLIRKYFSVYKFYIKEVVYDVQMNGKKINTVCAKLNLEKNHPAK
ncbi:MAG: hypothetical protein K2K96_09620 [Lachnospiraceae bacterium]|nr:hypothetical protein [Lachnospiraceae bacterium]